MERCLQGLIVKEQSGFYWVEAEDGQTYRCRLRGKLKEEAQASDLAAIGDRVSFITVQEDGEALDIPSGIIESVAERHSALSRAVRTEGKRGSGQAEREHVLIANANQAFFVVAARQPLPNFKLLDRLLVAGERAEIEHLILIFNKIDLEDPLIVDEYAQPYRAMGYEVLYTSALNGYGIDALRERLSSGISVFSGQSGVGKTSLLNAVQPGLGRAVKSVSSYHEEGVHTTRDSVLVKLESGGYLADTPGIRQMALWDVEPDELDAYFRDIRQHSARCKFRDCTHIHERGCAVRAALERGELHKRRYEHFLQLREELRETYIVY
ncbi:MAG: ribosome small subunit-dependent GTPase A [Anaerolineae bacterium]|nr:ribosome small subunit-dependent GTPase A [Anaerolineae bacterium]MDW8173347.1 ribosome small subunit-dependent GTPase A [Anaerolineae bacterium]